MKKKVALVHAHRVTLLCTCTHLRLLQGLSHVQGGCIVVEPFCNVLQFSNCRISILSAHFTNIDEQVSSQKLMYTTTPSKKRQRDTPQRGNRSTDSDCSGRQTTGGKILPGAAYSPSLSVYTMPTCTLQL
jgi:hypothetical protein